MGVELKRFKRDELFLDQEKAWRVLRFFWPDASVLPASLTEADRGFAQGVLLEAIDGSYHMSFVEIIFRAFAYKVAGSFGDIKDMVRDFVKQASQRWFQHATGEDLKNPKIYESVRKTLANSFRSVWKIREATGELTY